MSGDGNSTKEIAGLTYVGRLKLQLIGGYYCQNWTAVNNEGTSSAV